MRLRSSRALALLTAAASVGLAGHAFGQAYTTIGSVSLTLSNINVQTYGSGFNIIGYVGNDDSGVNGQGGASNPVTYTNLVAQTNQLGNLVTQIPGSTYGVGAPYLTGQMQYRRQTSYGFSSGVTTQIYTTGTTEFYYSPTTGLHYFGQYSPTGTSDYQNAGLETNYSNGTANSPPVTTPYSSFVTAAQHTANTLGENSQGQIIGWESIEAPDSKSSGVLGKHSYIFNTSNGTYASLGLVSGSVGSSGASYNVNINYSNYNYTTLTAGVSTGIAATSTVNALDNQGEATGTTARYFNYGDTATNTSTGTLGLGTSTWFYSPSTGNVETGLYGPGYQVQKTFADLAGLPGSGGTGYSVTEADKGVNNGYEVGTTAAVIDNGSGSSTSLGTEAWEYTKGVGTTAVSLYQSGNAPSVAGFASSSFSYSYSVTSAGGTGNSRSTTIRGLNANGQVAGYSLYYPAGSSTSLGQDAFVYTPGASPAYKQVGLLTNGFAGGGTTSYVSLTAQRSSDIAAINAGGATIGTSTEYLSSLPGGNGSTGTTTVSWYNPAGGTAYQIGLNDPFHTGTSATGIFVKDSVNILTDTGLVAGSATRYAPGTSTTEGSDAFVYDSNTGNYYVLDPGYGSTTTNFSSTITDLTSTGIAVGSYTVGGVQSAFEWSLAGGWFDDLTSITQQNDPSLDYLTNAYSFDTTTGDIFANAVYSYGGVNYTSGIEVLAPTAVPEPASMTLLAGLTAVGCLRRRRRVAR